MLLTPRARPRAACQARRLSAPGGYLVIGRALHDPLRKLAGDPIQFAVEPTAGHGALAGLVEQATNCLELLDWGCRGPAGEFEDWPWRQKAVTGLDRRSVHPEQALADILGRFALRIGRRIVDDLATKSRDGGELVGVLQDRSHDLLHKNIAHHKG